MTLIRRILNLVWNSGKMSFGELPLGGVSLISVSSIRTFRTILHLGSKGTLEQRLVRRGTTEGNSMRLK